MQPEDNKALVRRFFQEGFAGLDPAVVDDVFAPRHVLSSPALGAEEVTGTEVIKSAIEEFRGDGGGVRCTIERQIAEGNWVATSYTLTQGGQDHVGLMLSRVAGGRIRESRVVASDVSGPDERGTARKAFN